MHQGRRQEQGDFYSPEQVKRTLVACGIEIQGEVGSDYLIFCPYHNNFRTPAGEVAKRGGHFFCFGCQRSVPLVNLVMTVSERSYFEAMRLIDSKDDGTDLVDFVEKTLEPFAFQEYDPQTILRLHQGLPGRGADYFASRGISRHSMEQFNLGYSRIRDMVTVPVHSPDGVCIGFVGRSVEGKAFSNSVDLARGKTLFNFHRVKRASTVFLTESSFDVIRLNQVGQRAVATLGASVSIDQIDLLKRYFRSIILVRDNDEAGEKMANKLTSQLGTTLEVVTPPDGFKDVCALNDEQLREFTEKIRNEI